MAALCLPELALLLVLAVCLALLPQHLLVAASADLLPFGHARSLLAPTCNTNCAGLETCLSCSCTAQTTNYQLVLTNGCGALSWLCCRGTSFSSGAYVSGTCDITQCSGNLQTATGGYPKCDSFNGGGTVTMTVDLTIQQLLLQVHDGNLNADGNPFTQCTGGADINCCGGGVGGCDSTYHVCRVSLDLFTDCGCPRPPSPPPVLSPPPRAAPRAALGGRQRRRKPRPGSGQP